MKCSKCENEYSNERFCPVCGYPASSTESDRRTQAERYASQFGDNFDMDTDEETGKIMDRATQAQQYEAQFNSDYAQLFNEYSRDLEREAAKKAMQEAESNEEEFEDISSNSDENLATYDDKFDAEAEEDDSQAKSGKGAIIAVAVVLIALLAIIGWVVVSSLNDDNKQNENSTTPTKLLIDFPL